MICYLVCGYRIVACRLILHHNYSEMIALDCPPPFLGLKCIEQFSNNFLITEREIKRHFFVSDLFFVIIFAKYFHNKCNGKKNELRRNRHVISIITLALLISVSVCTHKNQYTAIEYSDLIFMMMIMKQKKTNQNKRE